MFRLRRFRGTKYSAKKKPLLCALTEEHPVDKEFTECAVRGCTLPTSPSRPFCEDHYEVISKKTKDRRRMNKIAVVEYLGGQCIKCGLKDIITSVYDVHHTRPIEKESTIAELCSNTWYKIKRELDKGCVLVCSNCHRRLHYEQKEVSARID